jgi:hypothetical protein
LATFKGVLDMTVGALPDESEDPPPWPPQAPKNSANATKAVPDFKRLDLEFNIVVSFFLFMSIAFTSRGRREEIPGGGSSEESRATRFHVRDLLALSCRPSSNSQADQPRTTHEPLMKTCPQPSQ